MNPVHEQYGNQIPKLAHDASNALPFTGLDILTIMIIAATMIATSFLLYKLS